MEIKPKIIDKIPIIIEEKIVEENIQKIKPSQTLTKSNTKKDIILKIYNQTELSKNKFKEFLNAFIDVVIEEISNGNPVENSSIGKSNIVERALNIAVNP